MNIFLKTLFFLGPVNFDGSGGDFTLGNNAINGAVSEINNINSTLFLIGQYVGALIIAIGIYQIITAIHDQNSSGKMKASMLIGLGAILISAEAVMTTLALKDVNGNEDAKTIVQNTLSVFGQGLQYVGYILGGFAIFQMITALMQEDAREKADSTKLLTVSILLLCASTIMDGITAIALTENTTEMTGEITDGSTMANMTKYILYLISKCGYFTGIGLLAWGAYHFVLSIKDEDAQSKSKAVLLVGVGVVLISLYLVLGHVFDLGTMKTAEELISDTKASSYTIN